MERRPQLCDPWSHGQTLEEQNYGLTVTVTDSSLGQTRGGHTEQGTRSQPVRERSGWCDLDVPGGQVVVQHHRWAAGCEEPVLQGWIIS